MSPRRPRSLPEIRIFQIAEGQEIVAHHTVKVASLDDPALPESFRSHYEEGMDPRYEETEQTAIHMGLSFWIPEETCRRLAKRYSQHGSHIARVALTPGQGFGYLDPALETDLEHLTVWGLPDRLAAATVDIVPVES